jgi:hypothetical protein
MRQQHLSVRAQLLAFGFLLTLLALLVPSCAETSGTQPDGGGADVSVNPCGPGSAKMCGTTCVDVQNDIQNCGDCGTTTTASSRSDRSLITNTTRHKRASSRAAS